MTLFRNKYRIETTRLKGWDYAAAGWYFVTLCTRNRECLFGEVVKCEMHRSQAGEIACQYWKDISLHSPPNMSLDVFVVMPNHVHGIIVIDKPVETVETLPVETLPVETLPVETLQCNVSTEKNNYMSQISPKAGSLGAIIRSYKSAVTTWCHENNRMYFDWQPRYYDHIIRDERSVKQIRQYIAGNPARWDMDRNNPANLWM